MEHYTFCLSDVIEKTGFAHEDIALIRHAKSDDGFRKVWDSGKEFFEEYQKIQPFNYFHGKKYIFSFVGETKATGIKRDCKAINRGKGFSNFALAGSWMKVRDLQQIIDGDTNNEQPHVFIIDEINRGNISKIFGELITLIEDTKREGMPEAASAKLPYSGESFSVPNNVFIIGTMNTADRSIALMDSALRRRFSFEEMMPDANVLRSLRADKVADLDVAEMLDAINERITFLYDREHTIGHAFFTSLKDDPTIENLASIFKKSVIPLLQEYFYEDYQKIQMVLGDNGKSDDSYKFIKDSAIVAKKIFKGSVDEIVDLPEKKYEINEEALYNLESYKQIV